MTNKSILQALTPSTAHTGSTRMLRLIIGMGSIGGLLFGYDTGIISGALVLLSDEFGLTTVEQELVVGICIAGAFVSACCSGSLADRFGRRFVVLGSSLAFIAGSVLLCIANSIWFLYVGRFVVGLGVGSASMIVPVLLSECAPKDSRGSVVTCVNVAITFGQLFACVTAAVLQPYRYGWRIMLGMASLPALVQLMGFLYLIPESPRWLCRQGHVDRGALALRQLRDEYDVREELGEILEAVRAERDALEAEFGMPTLDQGISGGETAPRKGLGDTGENLSSTLAYQVTASTYGIAAMPLNGTGAPVTLRVPDLVIPAPLPDPPLRLLLTKCSFLRPLLLGVVLQATQQLAGINTVMYYSATIFSATGAVSMADSIWLALGTSLCNFAGSLLGQRLTDPIGRRRLTIGSLMAVITALLAIAAAFQFSGLVLDVSTSNASSGSTDDIKRRLDLSGSTMTMASGFGSSGSDPDPIKTDAKTFQVWTIFATICVYLLVFSPGLGSSPWTICSEIFPSSCRGVATSITTSANWAANFVVSISFLSSVRVFGAAGTFLFSACVSTILALWLYMYLPETKGVALEDVPALFTDDAWGSGTAWPRRFRDCWLHLCGDSRSRGSSGQSTRPRGLSRGFFYSSLGSNKIEERETDESTADDGDAPNDDGPEAAFEGRGRRASIKL